MKRADDKLKKYKQLEAITRWGKQDLLKKISKKASDEVAADIAWSYPDFLHDALTQIFGEWGDQRHPYLYLNGELREKTKWVRDFWVKKERMDIKRVKDRKEWLQIIAIIEDFLFGKLGEIYMGLGRQGVPIKSDFYPNLMTFYNKLCNTYIFDIKELEEKEEIIKKALITGFLKGRKREEAIAEYRNIFKCDDKKIFEDMLPEIQKTLDALVNIGEKQQNKREKNNKDNEDNEKFAESVISILQAAQKDKKEKEDKWIKDERDALEVWWFLNKLDYTKAKETIAIIKRLCLKYHHFYIYSLLSYETSKIGDKYRDTLNREIIWYYKWEPVRWLILEGRDTNEEKVLFFDEKHNIKLDEDNKIAVDSKNESYPEMVAKIFPKDILGDLARNVTFDDISDTSTQTLEEWGKINSNKLRIEKETGYKIRPYRSGYIYIWKKSPGIWKIVYKLGEETDKIEIHTLDVWNISMINKNVCSPDGEFYNPKISSKIMKENIENSIKQIEFLYNNIKKINNIRHILIEYSITPIKYIPSEEKEEHEILKNKQYPDTYMIAKGGKDLSGNKLYYIFDRKSNFFETIKQEKVEALKT